MNTETLQLAACLILPAYLLGAIPFGLIFSKIKGIDIRQHGSGNIGATNVVRVMGKKWGYPCFFLDVLKGLLPTLLAGMIITNRMAVTSEQNELIAGTNTYAGQVLWLCVATACIIGHMFPIYLKFKGGKGVATSLGVILGIWPFFTLTGVIVFLMWTFVWAWTRTVSIASIVSAAAFPLYLAVLTWRIPAWEFQNMKPLFVFSTALAILVIVKHKSNIVRLLNGTEK
ncbi:MAG: glycerol-3-phosphate 1-O-acyltransferase PlsY [Sedimentisphaerales bacterium]|nr:glycerol-3-phosphate 1-O-acyltransferase PlsY [Sedimentisphaerales bacterium]